MTVSAVLASLIPILWASGIGSDVMKPIAAPMVGGMITSTIHVLILVPVFFVLMKNGHCGAARCGRNPRSNKERTNRGVSYGILLG
jgi:Cu/Ag efflux pump CusA